MVPGGWRARRKVWTVVVLALVTARGDGDLIPQWERAQRRAGLLESSIERRTSDMRGFYRWLNGYPLLEVDKAMIEKFLDQRRGRGGKAYAARTRYARISTLHCFYAWAVDEELLDRDPTARIRRPKLRQGLPRPVATADLITAMREAGPQMRLWLALAAFAGLRCMEIAGLHRDDLIDGQLIRVIGKGEKERLVPMHPLIADLLATYPLPRRGPLFVHVGAEITPARVSKEVSNYCTDLDIDATAHNFRHWFGSQAFDVSGDIRTVADLLGHANINTTLNYAAHSPTRARAVVAAIPRPVERPAVVQPSLFDALE